MQEWAEVTLGVIERTPGRAPRRPDLVVGARRGLGHQARAGGDGPRARRRRRDHAYGHRVDDPRAGAPARRCASMLIDHPELLSSTAVEEFIRWVSPILNMRRTATVDHELHGQQIRQGDELLLLYGSANRDPRAFHDPDVLDVAREHNRHVAFGFGTHFCLGSHLARLEIRVMFEELLRRIPDWELVDPEEPKIIPATFARAYDRIRIRFTPQLMDIAEIGGRLASWFATQLGDAERCQGRGARPGRGGPLGGDAPAHPHVAGPTAASTARTSPSGSGPRHRGCWSPTT